jgi:putative resolvase
MDNYISGTKAAARIGIHINTLRILADEGKISAIKTPGGIRRYNVEKYIEEHINMSRTIGLKHNVCYCRVSTHGQQDDLSRQIDYMKNKYPNYEMITDIGSGINFDRKGLQLIIDYAIAGNLETLAVAYKDRLCRIGYPLIEHILTKYSNTKIIVENDSGETVNEEIAGDLMQIITVYTAKINGMRSYKKPVILP